jgi:hypothetical protein
VISVNGGVRESDSDRVENGRPDLIATFAQTMADAGIRMALLTRTCGISPRFTAS